MMRRIRISNQIVGTDVALGVYLKLYSSFVDGIEQVSENLLIFSNGLTGGNLRLIPGDVSS